MLNIGAVAFCLGVVSLAVLLITAAVSDDPGPEPTRYRVVYASCSDGDALILDEGTGDQMGCQSRVVGIPVSGAKVTTVFTDEETDRVVSLAKRLAQPGTPFGGEPIPAGLNKAEKQEIESLVDEIRRSHGETVDHHAEQSGWTFSKVVLRIFLICLGVFVLSAIVEAAFNPDRSQRRR